mmetsp:Transcript_6425/g.14530  ORF Transcript_6425/g.14530 Transcript_6425/m.14530 type:complete len:96 (+) Transcript_6425:1109-1396(+)
MLWSLDEHTIRTHNIMNVTIRVSARLLIKASVPVWRMCFDGTSAQSSHMCPSSLLNLPLSMAVFLIERSDTRLSIQTSPMKTTTRSVPPNACQSY